MKPTSSTSREVEFENLLATGEKRMRPRPNDDEYAPRSQDTISSPSRIPMLRDLSVLVLTIIAVAVCASCVQNLKLTPLTASVPTGQSATFVATFNQSGSVSALSTSWTLTQGS